MTNKKIFLITLMTFLIMLGVFIISSEKSTAASANVVATWRADKYYETVSGGGPAPPQLPGGGGYDYNDPDYLDELEDFYGAYKGVYDTSTFTLYDNGLLEIGEGTLGWDTEYASQKPYTPNTTYSTAVGALQKIIDKESNGSVKVKDIVFTGRVVAGGSADSGHHNGGGTGISGLFGGLTDLERVSGLEWFDTSRITDFSCLFKDSPKLKTVDLEHMEMKKAADLSSMFEGDTALESVNFASQKTKSVGNMWFMFAACENLKNIPGFEDLDTRQCQLFTYLFFNCTSLESLNLSKWDTAEGLDFTSAFANMTALKYLNISGWQQNDWLLAKDTEGVRELFRNDTALKEIVLGTNFADALYNRHAPGVFIPPIDVHSGLYTGRWIGETLYHAYGNEATGSDLKFGFFEDFAKNRVADTYTWEETLKVHDITIWQNDPWDKSDCLNWARDVGGQDIDINQIEISGEVDTKEVGVYEVQYTINTKYGKQNSKTAKVTVQAKDNTQGAPITVKYQDYLGNTLLEDQIITGNYNEVKIIQAPAIEGYKILDFDQYEVTHTLNEQTITFIYQKIIAAPITIKHQDKEGNKLKEDDEIVGELGEQQTIKAPVLKGYKLVSNNDNQKVTFIEDKQTLIFIYDKDEDSGKTAGLVRIKYQDKGGNTLKETSILTGNIGDQQLIEAPDLIGYKLISDNNKQAITFTDKDQTIVFIYEKQSITATLPDTGVELGSNGGQDVNALSKSGLPKTNLIRNSRLIFVGLLFLIGLSIVLFVKKGSPKQYKHTR